MCIYLSERERACAHVERRGRERAGEKESISRRLHTVNAEPDARPNPTNLEIMT